MGSYLTLATEQIRPSQDFLKERTLAFILDCLATGQLEALPPPPIVRRGEHGEGFIAIDGHNIIAVRDFRHEPIEVYVAESASDELPLDAQTDGVAARNADLRQKFDSSLEEAARLKVAGIDSFFTLRGKYPVLLPHIQYALALLRVGESDQFVFQRRDEHAPTAPNMLGLLGGTGEPGESGEQIIFREIREESSLNPAELSLRLLRAKEATSITDPTDKRLRRGYLFLGQVKSSDFKLYEGRGLEVYRLNEALQRDDVAPILRFLLDPLPEI